MCVCVRVFIGRSPTKGFGLFSFFQGLFGRSPYFCYSPLHTHIISSRLWVMYVRNLRRSVRHRSLDWFVRSSAVNVISSNFLRRLSSSSGTKIRRASRSQSLITQGLPSKDGAFEGGPRSTKLPRVAASSPSRHRAQHMESKRALQIYWNSRAAWAQCTENTRHTISMLPTRQDVQYQQQTKNKCFLYVLPCLFVILFPGTNFCFTVLHPCDFYCLGSWLILLFVDICLEISAGSNCVGQAKTKRSRELHRCMCLLT